MRWLMDFFILLCSPSLDDDIYERDDDATER